MSRTRDPGPSHDPARRTYTQTEPSRPDMPPLPTAGIPTASTTTVTVRPWKLFFMTKIFALSSATPFFL